MAEEISNASMLVAMAATTQSPKKSYKVGLPISSTAITLMKIAVPMMFKIKRFIIKKPLPLLTTEGA